MAIQTLRCAGRGKKRGAADAAASLLNRASVADSSSPRPPAVRKGPTGSSANATETDTPSIVRPTIHVGVAQHTTQKSVALARATRPAPSVAPTRVEPLSARLQCALRPA